MSIPYSIDVGIGPNGLSDFTGFGIRATATTIGRDAAHVSEAAGGALVIGQRRNGCKSTDQVLTAIRKPQSLRGTAKSEVGYLPYVAYVSSLLSLQ